MSNKKLFRGGKVFLAEPRAFEGRDILIDDGRIKQISVSIAPGPNTEVIDASDRLIAPGLIDFHMHAFRYGHVLSVDVDDVAPGSGTTTFALQLSFTVTRDHRRTKS